MGKVIISGDEHIRGDSPFYEAKRDYFKWFMEQPFNSEENYLINTGDFFHSRNPSPKEYDLAHWFIKNLKFKCIYILAGNGAHEVNLSKRTYAIDPLGQYDNVNLIKEAHIVNLGSLKFLLLPAQPTWVLNGKTENGYYQEVFDMLNLKGMDFDYVVGHFFHKNGFGEEIDLSEIVGKRRMGHNHVPSKDGEFVGVNTITRSDEVGSELYLNSIDFKTKEESKIDIPKFLDYGVLDYEKDSKIENKPATYMLYNIKNAPDEKSIYEKYGDIFINKWEKRKLEEDAKEEESGNNTKALVEHFDTFINSKKIKKEVTNKIREIVKSKEG